MRPAPINLAVVAEQLRTISPNSLPPASWAVLKDIKAEVTRLLKSEKSAVDEYHRRGAEKVKARAAELRRQAILRYQTTEHGRAAESLRERARAEVYKDLALRDSEDLQEIIAEKYKALRKEWIDKNVDSLGQEGVGLALGEIQRPQGTWMPERQADRFEKLENLTRRAFRGGAR